jgi:hypothetical protein
MDLNGIQRVTMGKANWFGWLVYYSLDSTMANHIRGVFAHLGAHKR